MTTRKSQTLRVQVVDFVQTDSAVLAMTCQGLGDFWDVALLQLTHIDFQRLIDGGVTLAELEAECIDSTTVDDDTLCVEVFAEWRESDEWHEAKRLAFANKMRRAITQPRAAETQRVRL